MRTVQKPFSLYIHIPYCISKCPYCDFNSHVVAEIPEKSYTAALIREIDYYAKLDDWCGRSVQSIFFGGGTPSTFDPSSIGAVLDKIDARFHTDANCEITLEANPGTVDSENFHGYRQCGVNRISVGVQSFQPRLLKFLGRIHSADEAKWALAVVRDSGFDNFNLDLIYANPGQTLEELAADLETALSFDSPHLSAYNLTVEEGTPFQQQHRNGKLELLNEDQEVAMAELIESRLTCAGFQRYEISNYARPGFHSRHNVNYWTDGDYLGLGAGAHSYRKIRANGAYARRWWNEKSPSRYMQAISQIAHAVAETELPDMKKAAGDFMFSGLRLASGISMDAFAARFGQNPMSWYPQISDWISAGYMEQKSDRLVLTRRGLMIANSLFVHFV
jgi:putative oxygen-independent coproporphyrinogen III oxidase